VHNRTLCGGDRQDDLLHCASVLLVFVFPQSFDPKKIPKKQKNISFRMNYCFISFGTQGIAVV
jgi:hypothetical protein